MRQPYKRKAASDMLAWVRQNDAQRDKQAKRRCDLNEACVEAALAVGHVFGHVNSGAAVFATQRETLKHTQPDQHDGREPSSGGEGRQQPDRRSGQAHNAERDQKSVLASHKVTDSSKKQSSEWTDHKPYGERRQVSDVGECVIPRRIELGCKIGS